MDPSESEDSGNFQASVRTSRSAISNHQYRCGLNSVWMADWMMYFQSWRTPKQQSCWNSRAVELVVCPDRLDSPDICFRAHLKAHYLCSIFQKWINSSWTSCIWVQCIFFHIFSQARCTFDIQAKRLIACDLKKKANDPFATNRWSQMISDISSRSHQPALPWTAGSCSCWVPTQHAWMLHIAALPACEVLFRLHSSQRKPLGPPQPQ